MLAAERLLTHRTARSGTNVVERAARASNFLRLYDTTSEKKLRTSTDGTNLPAFEHQPLLRTAKTTRPKILRIVISQVRLMVSYDDLPWTQEVARRELCRESAPRSQLLEP